MHIEEALNAINLADLNLEIDKLNKSTASIKQKINELTKSKPSNNNKEKEANKKINKKESILSLKKFHNIRLNIASQLNNNINERMSKVNEAINLLQRDLFNLRNENTDGSIKNKSKNNILYIKNYSEISIN